MAYLLKEIRRIKYCFYIAPMIWYASLAAPEIAVEPDHRYVLSGFLITVTCLLMVLKRWHDITLIHKLILHISKKKNTQPWDHFRGRIVPENNHERKKISRRAPDLFWIHSITRDFTLRLKNKTKIQVQIGRAWSLSPIREGDAVGVWGYWRKGYFRGFWIYKPPGLNRQVLRFWLIFQHGLHGTFVVFYLFFALYGLSHLGFISIDVHSHMLLIVLLHTLAWLALLLMIGMIALFGFRKNKSLKRAKHGI